MYGQGPNRGRGRGRGQASDNRGNRSRGYGRGRDQRGSFLPSQQGSHISETDDGTLNAHISERFGSRHRGSNGFRSNDSNGSFLPKLDLNPHIAEYVLNQEALCEIAGGDDWRSIPEIPTSSEISVEENNTIILPPNKIDRPWTKNERYLKTHYKLLREDATAPLREAVAKFKQDPMRMDNHDMHIYEQVRVVGLTFNYKGIATRIRFSTNRSGHKILWSSSKRLTSGTLVALTPTHDCFRNRCVLAIVAARPLANIEANPPEIDIFFGDMNSHELDPQQTFIMVEATQGYYEAYRHTLRALQKQSRETFPLSEYICQLKSDVQPPEYLVENPHRDLEPAVGNDDNLRKSFRSVDLLSDWPSAPSTSLDATQWEAMREILTRKIAIIQGPPGTGKTHVSKIAIEILLRNRSYDDPPIIVACQTNHALDQLLELVNRFEPMFIRLGGRSNSLVVKQRALFEVRKKEIIDDIKGSCYNKARRDISLEIMKMMSLLSPVQEDQTGPLSAEIMFKLGVISEHQRKSLEDGAKEWVRADNTTNEPLEMWLRKAVYPFNEIYTEDSFGFQEVEEDLEIEQLRELEAESGIVDEEDTEMLKGDFFPLSMGLTMPPPTAEAVDQAKRLLDTSRDLYRIPDHLKGPVYLVMQERAKAQIRYRLRESAKLYNKMARQIQIGHWERDAAYLQKASIIGMTTTGLSKYRALVSALKPKVILIEEAAEVLEAPVSVSCVESLQQLILVGDHQQLQAHCSVRELEGVPYFLNISMFERLVRNQLPHKTLLRQRRMDPEFRMLIAPVYPKLDDHETVKDRPINPWGTGQVRLWWFNHDLRELQDQQMSTYNDYEASMIAKFYRHLIRNGVPAAAITVLTFYNGQRKRILRELKDEVETASIYNKVKTVDSYQGEENHIIILSLVRSNDLGRIGFLDINNRVTVALSRAKFGFYLFGNGDLLAEHNELWYYVFNSMKQKKLVRNALPTVCVNHGNQVWIKDPMDFDKLNGGGCLQLCDGMLSCGHRCPLRCHVMPHERILCHLTCGKKLICGHVCARQCSEACACDCQDYQSHEQVLVNPTDQGDGDTAAWNSFSEKQLTAENVSRIDDLQADEDRIELTKAQLAQHARYEDAKISTNGSTKNIQHKANGRTRVEEVYSPQEIDPVSRALEDIHNQQLKAREAIAQGKQKELPVRQSKGPLIWGLDRTNDRTIHGAGAGQTEDHQVEHQGDNQGKSVSNVSWWDPEEEALIAAENAALREGDENW